MLLSGHNKIIQGLDQRPCLTPLIYSNPRFGIQYIFNLFPYAFLTFFHSNFQYLFAEFVFFIYLIVSAIRFNNCQDKLCHNFLFNYLFNLSHGVKSYSTKIQEHIDYIVIMKSLYFFCFFLETRWPDIIQHHTSIIESLPHPNAHFLFFIF